MAANYSQYTDHNEIGGVSVGLEDAKLAAADSVDEVASTDCVLMKDASGNPVKILKEDFNEAVRDALGSILSYNGLGTAIGKVAALGSSDNDFGSISTSDLASVLGVILTYQTIPNCKTQVHAGVYSLGEDSLNAPFRYGLVVAFPHTYNNDQIKFALNTSSGHRLAFMAGVGDWWYFDDVSV